MIRRVDSNAALWLALTSINLCAIRTTTPHDRLCVSVETSRAAHQREREAELKKKHGDKSIDFEVMVKDGRGRGGLNPVARK